eukprot:TRINITY_DN69146_c0_g2_i1.p1 TRINITY_DN69146_c0_g2~~TRINITY_DN69146_c0_g2_i1.p1  ORF type:complete len:697 (-),score=100.42 TRINITY_DN69146_c0_g2_i1:237-2327(-)
MTWTKYKDQFEQNAKEDQSPTSSMRRSNMITKMKRRVQSVGDLPSMARTRSGPLLQALHQEERWQAEGGWNATSGKTAKRASLERDESMVQLLNLLDPESLVDKVPKPGQEVADKLQHSALSRRGCAFVGGASALCWYGLRLAVRDLLQLRSSPRRNVVELHILSTVHALGWLVFLAKKLQATTQEFPAYCSRALVVSLGFYLHDCWALRGTLLNNPAMWLHQASIAATITSILRSKGVAWLAPSLMSLSLPTLVQELLQLCGTIGLTSARPEVRGLRLLWFLSFAASKLALIPLWLRHSALPELHQPSLVLGKLSHLVTLGLNVKFLVRAVRNLPRFLAPRGELLPVVKAYSVPLQGARAALNAVTAASVLGIVFSSYLSAPVAGVLSILALKSKNSRGLKVAAGTLCTAIAADKIIPQPKDSRFLATYGQGIMGSTIDVFDFRVYPERKLAEEFRKDRNYLIAVTPHGLFPWGVGLILVRLMQEGFYPNFVGASVLGALPIAGRILRALGFHPATRSSLRKCMQSQYPNNVTVILPGGIAEMFCIRDDIEVSAANRHAGFAEIVRKEGGMLVPGYLFGQSQLYRVVEGSLAKSLEWLSRKLQTSLVIFTGRWGTLLPYPQKVGCALGKAIDTRECKDGQEAFDLWLQGVKDIYQQERANYGWADRELYFSGEALPRPPAKPLDEYTALPQLSKL